MYKDNHILVNFSRSFPRIEEGERDKFPKEMPSCFLYVVYPMEVVLTNSASIY